VQPQAKRAGMDLAQAQDWSIASLADVVVEQGITRHVFRL
jgi:hypothetical protein